jgi:hypothetical protein
MIDTTDADRIADILVAAPPWARLALTSSDTRIRAQGADEISALIRRRLADAATKPDPNQLLLPIG